jgi:hypothetical protein
MRASSFDHVCTDAGLAPWPADVRAFLFARLRNVIGTTSRRRLSGRSAVTIGLLVLATVTNGPLAAGVARADVARGSLSDWVGAVCSYDPGRLTADPVPQWICPGIRRGDNEVSFDTLWFIFQFASQSQMESNRQLLRNGFGYAACTASDGSVTAFVSDVSGIGSRGDAIRLTDRALQPLENLGCIVSDNTPRQTSSSSGAPSKGFSDAVQGLVQNAVVGKACSNIGRFVFGKTASGDTTVCLSQTAGSGKWIPSIPLIGTRPLGSSCAGSAGLAAQTPDGIPCICVESSNTWEQY